MSRIRLPDYGFRPSPSARLTLAPALRCARKVSATRSNDKPLAVRGFDDDSNLPESAVARAVGRRVADGVRLADVAGDAPEHLHDLAGVVGRVCLAPTGFGKLLEEPRVRVALESVHEGDGVN